MTNAGKDINPLDFGKKIVPPDYQSMMTKVTSKIIAEQNKHLQLTLAKDLEKVLKNHQKQLENTLDGDPLTQYIPKTQKTIFISSAILKQKTTYQERTDKKTTRGLRRIVRLKKDQQRKLENEQIEPVFETDNPLLIQGASVIEKTHRHSVMMLPIGKSSISGFSSSLALGLYLRVCQKSRDDVQKLLNTFLFYLHQSMIAWKEGGFDDKLGPLPALVSKDVPLINVFDEFLFKEQRILMKETSSFSDAQILLALLEIYNKWSDLMVKDPVSRNVEMITHKKDEDGNALVSIQELIEISSFSYLKYDLLEGDFCSEGFSLTEKGNKDVSHFNPMVFAYLLDFLEKERSVDKDYVYFESVAKSRLSKGRQELKSSLISLAKEAFSKIELDLQKGSKISYPLFMHLGSYLLYCLRGGDYLDIYSDGKKDSKLILLLQSLVTLLLDKGEVGSCFNGLKRGSCPKIVFKNKEALITLFDFSDLLSEEEELSGGSISGPLYVALYALKKVDCLPQAVKKDVFELVQTALFYEARVGSFDMYLEKKAKKGFGNVWQAQLFPATAIAQLAKEITHKL